MHKPLRTGLLAVVFAGAFAASPAAAQDPDWFHRMDGNGDGRITWNEYRRGAPSWESLGLDRNGRPDVRGR